MDRCDVSIARRAPFRPLWLAFASLLAASSLTLAQAPAWQFTKVVAVGDRAPGGDRFDTLFAPGLNNLGELALDGIFLVPEFGEGVYVAKGGRLTEVVRTGHLAPGGGIFGGFGLFGSIGLNDSSELAFNFGLDPAPWLMGKPLQYGAGVYRRLSGEPVKAVVVPFVTAAPGGGTFQGSGFHASINSLGTAAFAGVVETREGSPGPMGRGLGLGQGVYVANRAGQITAVAGPGDAAPGGDTFDYAEQPWINDQGDVAFGGHLHGDQCIDLGQKKFVIFCAVSVYIKDHDGGIRSIAHQGDPAPGGGTYRLAFGPVINNNGDLVFIGDLTKAPDAGDNLAVFLHKDGVTQPIARRGDAMPGGGHLLRASFTPRNVDINESGDVVFAAALDTTTGDLVDHGLYLWSRGRISLIARTGMKIPGMGTISQLSPPPYYGAPPFPYGYAVINELGQVAFQALMKDDSSVVLLATPHTTFWVVSALAKLGVPAQE